MIDFFNVLFLAVVFLYIMETTTWNKGICSATSELWIYDGVDNFGRNRYVSSNYFSYDSATFIFPVSML